MECLWNLANIMECWWNPANGIHPTSWNIGGIQPTSLNIGGKKGLTCISISEVGITYIHATANVIEDRCRKDLAGYTISALRMWSHHTSRKVSIHCYQPGEFIQSCLYSLLSSFLCARVNWNQCYKTLHKPQNVDYLNCQNICSRLANHINI